jgi:hypothetical protein
MGGAGLATGEGRDASVGGRAGETGRVGRMGGEAHGERVGPETAQPRGRNFPFSFSISYFYFYFFYLLLFWTNN